MVDYRTIHPQAQFKALLSTTLAFVVCFAVWTLFSIIGVQIKGTLGLSNAQFGMLIATPVLTGAISRLPLGILADQYGGRWVALCVMLISAAATWAISLVDTYIMYLVTALGLGLAGGFFAVGVAYISRWYPKQRQGTVLGIFGAGVVGAAVTSFFAPFLLEAFGMEYTIHIYAAALAAAAVIFWLVTENEPGLAERRTQKTSASILRQFEPLRKLQVWRFALYYFFVFGAFVGLTLWLPKYYMAVYAVDIKTAGMLTTVFALPGGIFRIAGGFISDKIGARRVMYLTFIACVMATFVLSYPATDYIVHGIDGEIKFSMAIGLTPFVVMTGILSMFMSFGMAAVFKHIPVYYPDHVGAVGGMVGLIGGLGGFVLPITFGLMNDRIGVWTSCFMLLFGLVAAALVWMHTAIRIMERREHPALKAPRFLPELEHSSTAKMP